MNERIKKFAKESNLMEFIDGLQPIIYTHDIKRVEKFAELIIKECADQCGIHSVSYQIIKKHFGIE